MFATIDRSCKRKKQKKKKKKKRRERKSCIDDLSTIRLSQLYIPGNDRKRLSSSSICLPDPKRTCSWTRLIPLSFPFPPPFPFLPDDRWNCNENFTRCEFPVPKLARIRVGGLTRQSEHCSQTETSRISLIRVWSVAAYRLSDAIVFHARIEGEEGVY